MNDGSSDDSDLPHIDGITETDTSGRGRNRGVRNSDIAEFFIQHDAVHEPEVTDPVLKSRDIAREVDPVARTVRKRLNELEDDGVVARKSVGSGTVWWRVSDESGGDSVPEKMQVILDVFKDAQAVYEPNVTHPVLATTEIADRAGLSDRQVRERLAEMQDNMDVRKKSVGSGTIWWVVTSKDPVQPSLGDLDLSDIT